ncbi:SHOCT domain-containing protein [Streptomyces sp. NBC_01431]|uniref:SHOCT domain-containing protein n=1 Tax=Streptomyces sp. NBC_01431 TaxID=2903863 RepID=UPI002E32ECED|nr:SHOCT domain-containing protein [Streptomyces sp. NBC_01431]
MMWFFLWVMWLILLFRVIGDIFRDDVLSGWGKAGWTLFVCVLPFLGVFIYLIARGRGMGRREARQAQKQEQAFRSYVQEAAADAPASGVTRADELAKLAGLHNHGDITDSEYEKAKTKVLAA